MKAELLQAEIEVPDGVQVSLEGSFLTLKGPKGEIKRVFVSKQIKLSQKENKIVLSAKKATKREKKMLYSFQSHIRNMVKGVTDGHVYELKICSGHFPMTVKVDKDKLVIKNFFGETVPRELKLKQGAKVSVDGDKVIVESVDKEIAGQCAADIESITRRTDFDRRIFQDGIYITKKSSKDA